MCATCHGAHDIAAIASPDSMVHPSNKVKTCAQCHKGATENFAATFTHHPLTQRSHPIPYWTMVFFSFLTSVVLTLLVVHVLLDFGSEVRRIVRQRRGLSPKEPHLPPGAPVSVQRFDRHQLVQHWLLIGSVLTLVITEWPLRGASISTSATLVALFGGVHQAGLIHRIAAIVMGAAAVYHLGYLTVKAARRESIFGMVPTLSDVRNIYDNFSFFLGLRSERPEVRAVRLPREVRLLGGVLGRRHHVRHGAGALVPGAVREVGARQHHRGRADRPWGRGDAGSARALRLAPLQRPPAPQRVPHELDLDGRPIETHALKEEHALEYEEMFAGKKQNGATGKEKETRP